MTLNVDAHIHLWSTSRLRQLRWLTDGSPLNKHCTLDDYAKVSPAQIAIFVECDVFEVSNHEYALQEVDEALLYAKENASTRIGAIIAWAPMLATRSELSSYLDRVEARTVEAGLPIIRGFRFLLQQKPRSVAQSPELRNNLLYLQERWPRCVFDLGIDVRRDGFEVLDDALDLVKAAPGITFVIDHLAKADMTGSSIPEAYRLGMAALANQTNVYIKISGCLTEVDAIGSFDEVLVQSPIAAYLSFLLETFGPSRLIWASDWPVMTLTSISSDDLVQRWYNYCKKHLKCEEIFGANAARIYQL